MFTPPCDHYPFQQGRAAARATAARHGRRGGGSSRGARQGHRRGGRAESRTSSARSLRGDRRLAGRPSAALPADAEHHFGGEELDDRVPSAHRHHLVLHERQAGVHRQQEAAGGVNDQKQQRNKPTTTKNAHTIFESNSAVRMRL